ncbi:MAG: hypothetical protein HY012_01230, partial [Acidobacteria bacterium]|nr:hypothetical protein [Acidobacteriota bacterium]
MTSTRNNKPAPGVPAVGWIRPLAAPYLRGFRARAQSAAADSSLRGYWFEAPHARDGIRRGFFVGYLNASDDFTFLEPQPPECLVFAFVAPVGGALHRRLVRAPDSLLRKTFAYIRWLTHRLPRFVFFEDRLPAMVRHRSMREWPAEKYEHFSRNFFIETCAWLVRSGLVRKFAEESAEAARVPRRTRAA